MNIKGGVIYSVFLHLLLIGLAVDVFYLSKQTGDLRKALATAPPQQLAEGDLIQPVEVREMDGGEARLVFEGAAEETLLLVFTTTCPVCKRNQAAWSEIHDRFKGRFNVVGVSGSGLEATQAYRAEFSLPFRVVVAADAARFATALGISTVPQTLHIGKDGKLRRLWRGPLSEGFSEQLEESAPPQERASL